MRLEVQGEEFFIDLLLFQPDQLRYVVVELKVGKFVPAHLGQLQFYVNVVDQHRRRPDRHAPTIGILVCTYGMDQVIRFALGSAQAPMAVATYTYETLPAAERATLPSMDDIAGAIISTPTLEGKYADELLARLGTINPHLNHRRSIGRARSTLLDVRQGKAKATLVRNTRMRFSNGNTVELDDKQANEVLDIIRDLYQRVAIDAGGATDSNRLEQG